MLDSLRKIELAMLDCGNNVDELVIEGFSEVFNELDPVGNFEGERFVEESDNLEEAATFELMELDAWEKDARGLVVWEALEWNTEPGFRVDSVAAVAALLGILDPVCRV